MPESEPGRELNGLVTAPVATALAAFMALIGGIAGALITSYFSSSTSLELEQIKFETGLILKAIDTNDQGTAVKTLKFLANAGLIRHYEARINIMTVKENDLQIPAIGTDLSRVITSPISSFSYQTSPTEVEPGRRDWRRVDATHWTETYPNGRTSRFVDRLRINLNGCAGLVVENEAEPGFQIYIPDKGCPSMALWFRRGGQSWIYLQPISNIS